MVTYCFYHRCPILIGVSYLVTYIPHINKIKKKNHTHIHKKWFYVSHLLVRGRYTQQTYKITSPHPRPHPHPIIVSLTRLWLYSVFHILTVHLGSLDIWAQMLLHKCVNIIGEQWSTWQDKISPNRPTQTDMNHACVDFDRCYFSIWRFVYIGGFSTYEINLG